MIDQYIVANSNEYSSCLVFYSYRQYSFLILCVDALIVAALECSVLSSLEVGSPINTPDVDVE